MADIFMTVRELEAAWYRKIGKQPTDIYLGRNEWRDLRLAADANRYIIATAAQPDRELFGMAIHVTDDESHIGFGV